MTGSYGNQTVEMEQVTCDLLNCPSYYTTKLSPKGEVIGQNSVEDNIDQL